MQSDELSFCSPWTLACQGGRGVPGAMGRGLKGVMGRCERERERTKRRENERENERKERE